MIERDGTERDDAPDSRPAEAPVDGSGGAGDNEDAGGTSYDQPGGSEHGTTE